MSQMQQIPPQMPPQAQNAPGAAPNLQNRPSVPPAPPQGPKNMNPGQPVMPPAPPAQGGMPVPPPMMEMRPMLIDLTLHKTVKVREVRIDPIPSEQVIISGDAADVEHARFVAHWEVKTASDLRKEGYGQDVIDELPMLDDDDEMPEAEVSRSLNAEMVDRDGLPSANREYKVYEAWTDFDINGDGIAEKVKVTYVGSGQNMKILKTEEWPLYRAPLFAACSVPMPHQVVGLCVADLVSDLQDLRTEITRQYLDNLSLSNQSELVANSGQSGSIDYDSLLARGVGSVHRVTGDATITPLSVPNTSADALQGLSMTSDVVERRTGISSRTQSIQADTLQNTATGASIMEESINQRLELVARVYAETFFKPLGRYLLHLVQKYQDKKIQLRIKGRFMEFDPRRWDPDMDISVAVGLGTGNRSKLISAYQQILQIQQAFLTQLGSASPVKLSNIIYTCQKMAEAAGLEAPERFFGTEEDAKKAEQMMSQNAGQQDNGQADQLVKVEQAKAQAQIQTTQAKTQAQIQLNREKAQNDAQLKAIEMQSKLQLEREKAAGHVQLRAQEMQAEAQLDAMRIASGSKSPGLTNVRGAW